MKSNKHITIATSLALTFILGHASAFAENTSTESNQVFSAKPQVKLGYGFSTNPLELNQSSTTGGYLGYAPKIDATVKAGNSVTIDVGAKLIGKSYLTKTAEKEGGEMTFGANTGIAIKTGDSLSLIGTYSAASIRERTSVVTSTNSLQARSENSVQQIGEAGIRFQNEDKVWKLLASGENRDYTTILTDINGNRFSNDFGQGGVKVAYKQNPVDMWESNLTGSVMRRFYDNRMAEYTDGFAAWTPGGNPKMKLTNYDLGFSFERTKTNFKPKFSVGLRYEDDTVYGARDAWYPQAIASTQLKLNDSNWTLLPKAGLGAGIYQNFRSYYSGEALTSPLRRDIMINLQAAGSYEMQKGFEILPSYTFNRQISNYALESFAEHTVELSTAISL